MRAYRPRRSAKRWLEGAPDYILACYDKPSTADRYTILLAGPFWRPEMGRRLQYLSLSSNPNSPLGVSMFGEIMSFYRTPLGKKIKWQDLPEEVRDHIIARTER